MNNEYKIRGEMHKNILQKLYNKYKDLENDKNEFTWDGPSNWEKWENQLPKILFLLKEARAEFQPCVPNQIIENKTGRNMARWRFAIQKLYERPNVVIQYPINTEEIENSFDNITIVEIKKINEGRGKSDTKEIINYARKDKDLLKEQIDALNPQIIICCGSGTSDAYDLIYDETYQINEELIQIGNKKCWNLNNRLVIDFYHPSTFPGYMEEGAQDVQLFEMLRDMMNNGKIFENFTWNQKFNLIMV